MDSDAIQRFLSDLHTGKVEQSKNSITLYYYYPQNRVWSSTMYGDQTQPLLAQVAKKIGAFDPEARTTEALFYLGDATPHVLTALPPDMSLEQIHALKSIHGSGDTPKKGYVSVHAFHDKSIMTERIEQKLFWYC